MAKVKKKKLNVENCKECSKVKADSKFYPYCSLKHWQEMVAKH